MPEDPDLPPWARAKPRRIEARPPWVIMLALGMLMFGGRFLKIGLDEVYTARLDWAADPRAGADLPPKHRVFGEVMARGAQAHQAAVRANGAVRLAVGAL